MEKKILKIMYKCVKLIHSSVQQRLAQHCKATIFQLKKINNCSQTKTLKFHILAGEDTSYQEAPLSSPPPLLSSEPDASTPRKHAETIL